MNSFRELKVWQKAMNLVTSIYSNTSTFPQSEQFGITSQIRRSSVSIPSNIAEGFGRNTKKEFVRFLRISIASLFELQTQLEISKNLNYITFEKFDKIIADSIEIEKMLKALIKSIQNK
jgi:four helix bundle protein